jgi:hypothetical protein
MVKLSALSGLLLVAGCGSLRGDTDRNDPLGTMTGFLSGSDTQLLQSHPRVAVVWMQDDGAVNVSEDLPVEPMFPSRFAVPLHHPPPEGAMMGVDGFPGARVAFGALVAYDDRNGNGALDLVGDDATAFVDAILGGNPTLAIAYFEGELPKLPGGTSPPPGYTLVMPNPVCAGQEPDHPESCDWDTLIPIDRPYELKVEKDPEVSTLMCQRSGFNKGSSTFTTTRTWDVATGGAPPSGYPEPNADGLVCGASGSSYQQSLCRRRGQLCHVETDCEIWTVELQDAPRPPGWPCP